MRLTKQRLLIVSAAASVVVCVGVAAALGWWHVALTLLAGAQVTAIVAVLDVRRRVARSGELRKIARSVETAQRRIDNVGTRMIAAAETSRVEVTDRLTEIERGLEDDRHVRDTLQKDLADTVAALSRVDELRAGVEQTNEHITRAFDEAAEARQRQEKVQNAAQWRHIRQSEALIQLYTRVRPRASMPSAGGWALDPTAILTLLEIIDRRHPRLIVELGSGTSTLWLAYALEALGTGRIVTIDHEERFAVQTREHLRAHGLDEIVEVRLAPLVEAGLPGHSALWYDHAAMEDLTGIDLLIVDGPPQRTGTMARYPAMRMLGGQLADTAVVALDDATRPDEKEVVQRWCDETDRLRPWPVPPGDALQALILDRSPSQQAG